MTTENTKKTTADNTKKPANPSKPQPVKVCRNGAIAASIWPRQTATGFAYFDFSLSRSWKSSASGKEGYSTNFFPQNADALAEVIQQAADWISEHMTDAAEPSKESPPNIRQAA